MRSRLTNCYHASLVFKGLIDIRPILFYPVTTPVSCQARDKWRPFVVNKQDEVSSESSGPVFAH